MSWWQRFGVRYESDDIWMTICPVRPAKDSEAELVLFELYEDEISMEWLLQHAQELEYLCIEALAAAFPDSDRDVLHELMGTIRPLQWEIASRQTLLSLARLVRKRAELADLDVERERSEEELLREQNCPTDRGELEAKLREYEHTLGCLLAGGRSGPDPPLRSWWWHWRIERPPETRHPRRGTQGADE